MPVAKNCIAGKETTILAAAMMDHCDSGLFLVDANGEIRVWNCWMAEASGITAATAMGARLKDLFRRHQVSARLQQAIDGALRQGMASVLSQPFNPHVLPLYRYSYARDEDKLMFLMVVVRPLDVEERYAMVQISDISSAVARDKKLRRTAAENRARELHTRAVLSSIADAVITTDEAGLIDYLNPVAEALTGWSQQEAIGRTLPQVFWAADEHIIASGGLSDKDLSEQEINLQAVHEMVLSNRSGGRVAIELSYAPIRNELRESVGKVLVFRDVSSARTLAAKVRWQATHDALTGLENRLTFDSKLEKLLYSAQVEEKEHGVMYLDLDQFKIVNDTCGHVAGDELLRQISALLGTYIRSGDTLARLGGDEFGVLLLSCPLEPAKRIANEMRQAISDFRFAWAEQTFSIGVSIGIVMITSESESVEKVLSAADTACYAAKEAGRNNVKVFSADEGATARHRGEMQWVARLQGALADDRFTLYAQSIVPIHSNRSGGHYEVLVRMVEQDGTTVPPGAFIPAAERFNLMSAIDLWVIDHVFALIKQHRKTLIEQDVRFAINLSGGSINDADTLVKIQQMLRDVNIPEGMVIFEITETATVANLNSAKHFIQTLKASGCQFSLDDFGSGLSSFAYLKNLPVDFLKIDGAFVKDLADDPIDYAMVEAINQIGHVMGLATIAEFAENDEVINGLRQIGVDYAQGYGVAMPMPLVDEKGQLKINVMADNEKVCEGEKG